MMHLMGSTLYLVTALAAVAVLAQSLLDNRDEIAVALRGPVRANPRADQVRLLGRPRRARTLKGWAEQPSRAPLRAAA